MRRWMPFSRNCCLQILQQNVLLKYKYFAKFLQQHGQEVFPDVRTAYVETLSRIYRSALCAFSMLPHDFSSINLTPARLLDGCS